MERVWFWLNQNFIIPHRCRHGSNWRLASSREISYLISSKYFGTARGYIIHRNLGLGTPLARHTGTIFSYRHTTSSPLTKLITLLYLSPAYNSVLANIPKLKVKYSRVRKILAPSFVPQEQYLFTIEQEAF